MKHQKQEAQGAAPLKKDGKLIDDLAEKANILNAQFKSVFSLRKLLLKTLCTRAENFIKPDGSCSDTPHMLPVNITEERVRRRLEKLKTTQGSGTR